MNNASDRKTLRKIENQISQQMMKIESQCLFRKARNLSEHKCELLCMEQYDFLGSQHRFS